MKDITFHDVWREARLAGLNLVLNNSFYAICDSNFKTLIRCTSLSSALWYIKNKHVIKKV